MRDDLTVGNEFPALRLPDETGTERSLSEIASAGPLVLAFVRGWWCPKEMQRLRGLVAMQDEVQVEYGKIAVVTVDPPSVNGALRGGLGAEFPFLSDENRAVASELDLLELTDARREPFLPVTFVLGSTRTICRIDLGYWFWGNPTPEELRQTLRQINREEQPSFSAQAVWEAGGAAAPAEGIAAEVVWIKEDSQGREFQRGVHAGPIPKLGAELGRSTLYQRPFIVHEIEKTGRRTAIHLRRAA